MCDSFVALPSATTTKTTLAAKNADCEINEAQAVLRLPRRRYPEGAMMRSTHIVVPQVRETHEIIIDKSYWTWGGEIGINEHGLAVGNEAIFSKSEEGSDGLITGDLLRLMLERARSCDEAMQVLGDVLAAHGQGGNCELRGNSHFDSSYLVSDRSSAYVIETAGREWVVRRVEGVGAISNAMTIHADWQESRTSLKQNSSGKIDFQRAFEDEEKVAAVGARQRQKVAFDWLKGREGRIGLRTMADLLRQHPDDYDPAEGEVCTNICMHAGPHPNRFWQACGAMIMETAPEGAMAWATATSGTCVSIFKPVYFGVPMPEAGPLPRETYTDGALWWKHEHLHRRAMASFQTLGAEIRASFEHLEDGFFAEGRNLIAAPAAQKAEFMDHCWRLAGDATDRWIADLERRNVTFQNAAFSATWDRFNRAAAMPWVQ
jgi:dipeptidase